MYTLYVFFFSSYATDLVWRSVCAEACDLLEKQWTRDRLCVVLGASRPAMMITYFAARERFETPRLRVSDLKQTVEKRQSITWHLSGLSLFKCPVRQKWFSEIPANAVRRDTFSIPRDISDRIPPRIDHIDTTYIRIYTKQRECIPLTHCERELK